MQFQQDHIFARSLFKPKELSTSGRLDWVRKKDRLGNLCLLLAHENIGKQDMPADEWLKSREPGFLKRHLIPGSSSLRFDRFPDFLEAREELVRQRLKWIFRQTGPQYRHAALRRLAARPGQRRLLRPRDPRSSLSWRSSATRRPMTRRTKLFDMRSDQGLSGGLRSGNVLLPCGNTAGSPGLGVLAPEALQP